jgi:CRP/FNR family transcriptional regulator, cyclic AMP receptor protein
VALKTDPKIELLRRVPLFGSCDSMDLKRVAAIADEVDVPDGFVIAREGAPEGQLAVIVEGTVRLERDGDEVRRIGPGEYIGEMALLDDVPRTTTATSDGPVKLVVLTNRAFRELLDEAAPIRATVFETLARRIRSHEPAG